MTLALAHFFMEVKKTNRGLPPELLEAVSKLPPTDLPPLPQPLNDEIRRFFAGLFSTSSFP